MSIILLDLLNVSDLSWAETPGFPSFLLHEGFWGISCKLGKLYWKSKDFSMVYLLKAFRGKTQHAQDFINLLMQDFQRCSSRLVLPSLNSITSPLETFKHHYRIMSLALLLTFFVCIRSFMSFNGSERDASTAGVNKSSDIEDRKEALNLSRQALHSSDTFKFSFSLPVKHRTLSSRVWNRRAKENLKQILKGTVSKQFWAKSVPDKYSRPDLRPFPAANLSSW